MAKIAPVLALLLTGCAGGIKPPPAALTTEFVPKVTPTFIQQGALMCLTEPEARKLMLFVHDLYQHAAEPRAYLRGSP